MNLHQTNPPDSTKIPLDDLLGVTALIISASFKNKEFFRAGYFVYNTLDSVEFYQKDINYQEIPQYAQVDISKVYRNILADKPRIVRYSADWDDEKDGMTNLVDMNNIVSNNGNILNGNSEIQFKGVFSGDEKLTQQSGNINMEFMLNNNTNIFPSTFLAQGQQSLSLEFNQNNQNMGYFNQGEMITKNENNKGMGLFEAADKNAPVPTIYNPTFFSNNSGVFGQNQGGYLGQGFQYNGQFN